ncbi:GtrA family protein [Streptomyces sp. NPDC101234]|uniref:GtrA family protein n=1 Tax=Streptomyces sp. NPDC101234 TaxID=3366138 RepID=UPI003812F7AA
MTSTLASEPETSRRSRRTETEAATAHRSPAAPGPLASFVRFVVCGGGVGITCGPAVTLLAQSMPWTLANALTTVASTVLCTELHARFTFGTGRRAGVRQHWQSAGSATAAYAVTSAAVLLLHTVQPSAGVMREQAVYLTASALAGIGRFLVLRLFVFAGRKRAAGPVRKPARFVKSGTRLPVLSLGRPAGSSDPAGSPALGPA